MASSRAVSPGALRTYLRTAHDEPPLLQQLAASVMASPTLLFSSSFSCDAVAVHAVIHDVCWLSIFASLVSTHTHLRERAHTKTTLYGSGYRYLGDGREDERYEFIATRGTSYHRVRYETRSSCHI